jgi:TRAP-type C4-dicarboxylate transport system permease small subunit
VQRLADVLDAVSRAVARIATVLCLAMLYTILALLAVQVATRYFLGAPPSWTEELAMALFTWTVLLFATVGVREGFHVAVDVLADRGPPWLRRSADRLVMVVTVGFGAALTWSGYAYVLRTGGQRSAALQFPIEVLHAAAPVCGALIAFHALVQFVRPRTPGGRDA